MSNGPVRVATVEEHRSLPQALARPGPQGGVMHEEANVLLLELVLEESIPARVGEGHVKRRYLPWLAVGIGWLPVALAGFLHCADMCTDYPSDEGVSKQEARRRALLLGAKPELVDGLQLVGGEESILHLELQSQIAKLINQNL